MKEEKNEVAILAAKEVNSLVEKAQVALDEFMLLDQEKIDYSNRKYINSFHNNVV